MNSGEVDREGDEFRAFTLLSQKSKKSLDDDARLREMEWAMRLYLDTDIGPYLPGKNVKEMLRSAATKWKKGEDIKRSLIVVDYRIPLLYDGPRDQEGLWDKGYRYSTLVANSGMNRGRVVRTRPCFEEWAIETLLAWDPEDLDYDMLRNVVERSMKFGLGDYRPEYGSFLADLGEPTIYKEGAHVNGPKPTDRLDQQAHAASVRRVRREPPPPAAKAKRK
jgi:hypothetical protein